MIGRRVITLGVVMSVALPVAAAEPPASTEPAPVAPETDVPAPEPEPEVPPAPDAPVVPEPEASPPSEPSPAAPDGLDPVQPEPPDPSSPSTEDGAVTPDVSAPTSPVVEPDPPPLEPEPEPDEAEDPDPFGDESDEEPWPDDEEVEPLSDYDPLRDSPQAIRARHWVRGGILMTSAGGALLIGAILMSASNPCNLAIGNSCQADARNRAALVMGVPAGVLLGGGAAALVTGLGQRQALALELSASRRQLGLGVRGRF